jgi:phthalate 4,5-dioxygenase oxygenase subunit
MGPIVDRAEEHLGSSDKAVVAARLLLLKAVKSVQADADPPGIEPTYHQIRAIEKVLPKGVSWKDSLRAEIFTGS